MSSHPYVTQQNTPLADDTTLMSTTDLQSYITHANDTFVQVSGFTLQELQGQPHNMVRHPDMPKAAFADIEAKGYMKDRVVVVDGENWHHGVIGIVASRVTERCGKPCMIISRGETEAKGSGRSIEGFSLFEAICACGDLLIKFGGHPMAAGITLKPENIEAFRKRINQYAAEHFPQMPTQTVTLDCKLNPAALSVSMAQSLTHRNPADAKLCL